nr:hypothetical protein [uncultured Selenomonas sp.]
MSVSTSEFKVVRILDEYRIIINAGFNDGVTDQVFFKIAGVMDTIYDPDTHELLGTLDGTKAVVFPSDIFEKMSICKASPKFYDLPKYDFFMPEKLFVDKSQITNPEVYTPISIGDKAILCYKND